MARKIRAKLIMELREQGLSRRMIAKTCLLYTSSAQPSVPAPQLALSHDLAKIVEVAQEKGGFTRRDVESALNYGATKAKGLIAELLGMGIIASEGSARGTRYRLR